MMTPQGHNRAIGAAATQRCHARCCSPPGSSAISALPRLRLVTVVVAVTTLALTGHCVQAAASDGASFSRTCPAGTKGCQPDQNQCRICHHSCQVRLRSPRTADLL